MNDTTKFKELILYICERSKNDDRFASTKLNKLLFFIDFSNFRATGSAVTGQEYQKLEFGPAPRNMVSILAEMQAVSDLAFKTKMFYGMPQKQPVALREANLDLFIAKEIALAETAIDQLWQMNAREISELSHQFPAWQLAKMNETIPYEASLLESRELTEREKQWAHEIDMSDVERMLSGAALI
jgi:hypothetical protein